MATIKDIARIAGVSQGTVSNVLNGRNNVSAEKIRLVHKVAQQLGYSINMPAQQLRGTSKGVPTVALILPNVSERKYNQIFETVEDYFKRQKKNVFLFVTGDLLHVEQSIVETIAAMRVAGVISVTCCHDGNRIYKPLVQSGSQVIFLLRDSNGCGDLITFDYYRAGQEVAAKVLSFGVKTVGIVDSPDNFSGNVSFKKGLQDMFHHSHDTAGLTEPTLSSYKTTLSSVGKTIAHLFVENSVPELILCASSEYADQIRFAVEVTAPPRVPIIITLSDYALCMPKSPALHYYLDYRRLAAEAAEQLDQKICAAQEKTTSTFPAPCTAVLPPKGFLPGPPLIRTKTTELNVLLMKGQMADALISTAGRFSAQSNIKVNFTVLPPEEIYKKCMDMENDDVFDVVRVSVSVLPIMPKQAFRPFEESDYRAITSGMTPVIVGPLSLVNNVPYAVPFDVGSQVLVYRKDIFMDPMVKRLYFEQYGESLEVPTDFNSFNRIVSYFNRSKDPFSPVKYGATASIGTDSEAFLSFILRYRALIKESYNEYSLDDFSLSDCCEAFTQCRDFYKDACVISTSSWFGKAHDNFTSGNSAMEIIAFNYASDITDLHTLAANTQIGCSMVPGRQPVLGGGSLLITNRCKEYQAALKFVSWACGRDDAELLTYLGGTSPHLHVYQNQEILKLYPWYRLFLETLELSSYRKIWDQFHVYKLEHLIGRAVRCVAFGKMTPEEASSFVAARLSSCRLKSAAASFGTGATL